MNYIQLYQPSVHVKFNFTLKDIQMILHGFKQSENTNNIVLHGEAMLTEADSIIVHFYFDKVNQKLTDCMIHPKKVTSNDTLQKSFARKQAWLEGCYGKADEYIANTQYPTSIWNFEHLDIKHFIQDRFGDEEGIFFQIRS